MNEQYLPSNTVTSNLPYVVVKTENGFRSPTNEDLLRTPTPMVRKKCTNKQFIESLLKHMIKDDTLAVHKEDVYILALHARREYPSREFKSDYDVVCTYMSDNHPEIRLL